MKNILESKVKIRFQDCDPFNHLNNSKYIDYFINAREDQILEHYDLDIYDHIKTNGRGWVVVSNQISYLKPAVTMEEILIESQLIEFSESVLKVEMKMWNLEKTVLKSIYWTTFIYFDIKTQKKANHSEELTELFKKIINPISDSVFEKRCYSILSSEKGN